MAEVTETVVIAVRHHQAGRLQQAQQLYQQVLKSEPDNPVVLHSLGLIACQRGQKQQAVDLIARAIEVNPRIPQFYNTFGIALEALGRY